MDIYEELELINWQRRKNVGKPAAALNSNAFSAQTNSTLQDTSAPNNGLCSIQTGNQSGITSQPSLQPQPPSLPTKTDQYALSLLQDETLLPARQKAWCQLLKEWENCTRCPLHATRNQLVIGSGSLLAKVMLIGEAPGENEDKQGEPFVGRAGQLLQSLLRAINLDRQQIFIANVLKCRPPRNRDPMSGEVTACTPFLKAQIELIKPSIIVAVGRIAAQYLLKSEASMKELRKQWLSYPETQTPLLVTYHPAYLLRSPQEKAKAYQDFLLIKNRLLQEATK